MSANMAVAIWTGIFQLYQTLLLTCFSPCLDIASFWFVRYSIKWLGPSSKLCNHVRIQAQTTTCPLSLAHKHAIRYILTEAPTPRLFKC